MSLTALQTRLLTLIAANRDPESYVAGASPLTVDAYRTSEDIDIFHDIENRVRSAADRDIALLQSVGLEVTTTRSHGAVVTVTVSDGLDATKLEWLSDSDFRFFPAIRDPVFGYRLHLVDIATNKIMAAAGRREARDAIDLLHLHENYLSLGAIAFAATDKSPGFTPEHLLREVRRATTYRAEELLRIRTAQPIDPLRFFDSFSAALESASAFVSRMPSGEEGTIYLKNGRAIEPDPSRLHDYVRHRASRRGHWPTSSELLSDMIRSDRL